VKSVQSLEEAAMRALRVVGLGEDGKIVILESDRGERFKVPADERLRAAARGDITRLGQIAIELESQMRPREIQSRIRAGESVEQVAAAAGVPPEKVERFAYPVLLERSRTAELAQRAHPVREDGPDVQELGEVVSQAFTARGQDYLAAVWDSWKGEDGKWVVQLTWTAGRSNNHAHWSFHPGAHGGTVTPLDDHALDLLDPNPNRQLRTVRPVTELAAQALAVAEPRRQAVNGGEPPLRGEARRVEEQDFVQDFELTDEMAEQQALQVEDPYAGRYARPPEPYRPLPEDRYRQYPPEPEPYQGYRMDPAALTDPQDGANRYPQAPYRPRPEPTRETSGWGGREAEARDAEAREVAARAAAAREGEAREAAAREAEARAAAAREAEAREAAAREAARATAAREAEAREAAAREAEARETAAREEAAREAAAREAKAQEAAAREAEEREAAEREEAARKAEAEAREVAARAAAAREAEEAAAREAAAKEAAAKEAAEREAAAKEAAAREAAAKEAAAKEAAEQAAAQETAARVAAAAQAPAESPAPASSSSGKETKASPPSPPATEPAKPRAKRPTTPAIEEPAAASTASPAASPAASAPEEEPGQQAIPAIMPAIEEASEETPAAKTEPTPPPAPPAKKKGRKARPSVPSWEDVLLGTRSNR
jgi:hypothetical protein